MLPGTPVWVNCMRTLDPRRTNPTSRSLSAHAYAKKENTLFAAALSFGSGVSHEEDMNMMNKCPSCSAYGLKEITLEYTDKQVVTGKCFGCGYTEQHEYPKALGGAK